MNGLRIPNFTLMSVFRLRLLYLLMFVSGFAALVYQVLWMKQLGLLFGNTAEAAGVTLAVFFGGLAFGSWFWGRRASNSAAPLRLYALLEIGIAAKALIYFGLLGIFRSFYPSLYQADAGAVTVLLFKLGLSLLLVFPPSFFMGGTLPAIGEFLTRRLADFSRTAALIYGINTLGAAVGVAAAAFLLVPALGFRLTYAVAVSFSLAVGAVAWWLARGGEEEVVVPSGKVAEAAAAGTRAERIVVPMVAFFSGFGVLALEVLWTRMFAQVHENSVYAFAMILVVVLTCLAAGAALSARIARQPWPPVRVLGLLMLLGGLALAFGPLLFMKTTSGMKTMTEIESWQRFVFSVFTMGFLGIGPVVIVLGMVFPFLMKAAGKGSIAAGRTLGWLLALNTCGAILGAMLCGFVLLPALGIWGTMSLITALYLLAGILAPYGSGPFSFAARAFGSTLLLMFLLLKPSNLPATGTDPARKGEVVLETWEGADSTVSVVEKQATGNRMIKINSAYVLGSTANAESQTRQGSIPLQLFPQAESVFFLGMGTGNSAGAALSPEFPQVKRVVTCELSPGVVEAARKYMPPPLLNGLFDDPRSRVLIEDGRHHLMATDEKFDIINADLFLPYSRGAGSLYSLEHYRDARKRLNPGGSYVQWLPLYQLTEFEFGVIARTMIEAFGHVSMWRNNFVPGHEIVALIGQPELMPITAAPNVPPQDLINAVNGLELEQTSPEMAAPFPETLPFFYGGNLTVSRDLFDAYPVNTDDRPVIEYQTPKTFRAAAGTTRIWHVGPDIADLTARLLEKSPLETDPVLAQRTKANRGFARAGLAFHRALIHKVLREGDKAQTQWREFQKLWRESAEEH
jgi:spermidine synthase